MGAQPTPIVTRNDIERIVRRDFPENHVDQALSTLSRYGGEDWHREPERVHIAALKIADGKLDRLSSAMATATADFRDILAQAEYPEYLRCVAPSSAISPDERQQIIDADWKQYREWLER